jgi:predicted acylesterase/phospholipase RssA
MTTRTFEQHLDPAHGPKRILALDGGGLRGVLTIAFLKQIEDILRLQTGGDEHFRLSDYFDLIAGTSTGSIIAAGLALGMSVDELRGHYFALGEQVFKPSIFSRGLFNQKYDAGKVAGALRGVFGERTLGSPDFKTGLLILCKRLDTGSQWVLSNNPKARYYHAGTDPRTVPNKDYPLWSVVRASTAAPTYFEPEEILVTAAGTAADLRAVHGEFIDGGVSTMNNPALQAVLAATVTGYGFGWPMGEDQLAVTSVGTGRASQALGVASGLDKVVAAGAIKALKSVLADCEDMVEVMMQWLSHSPTARPIDRQMGTLEGCWAGPGPSLRYHRYNVQFEPAWFQQALDQTASAEELDDLAQMDKPGNMATLEEIGTRAARRFVQPAHFATP